MADALEFITRKKRRRRYPGIPLPKRGDEEDLWETVMALKEAVELLTGQRADPKPEETCTVVWDDLVDLGLIEPAQLPFVPSRR